MGSFDVQGGNDYWSQFPQHPPTTGGDQYQQANRNAFGLPGGNTGVTGGMLGTPAPVGAPNDPRLSTLPQPYQQLQDPNDGRATTLPIPGNTGVTGGMLGGAQPQGGGGGDYQSEFMQAAQALGISPQQFRSNPQAMDAVTNYLNQKYPGQNWTNGGERAGDWVSANGQGFDVLPAGDRNWQWLSDPANSTAGTGNLGAMGFTSGVAGGGPFGGVNATDPSTIPGYDFAVGQAVKAFDRSAASKGTLLSGGYGQALTDYVGKSLAMPAYQYQVGNLFNLANLGFNAANQTNGAGANFASSYGNTLGQIGNAQANGTIGAANASQNATNQVLNGIGQIQWPWNQPKTTPPYVPTTTPGYPGGVPGDG